jgi:FkbM family methyltransferase
MKDILKYLKSVGFIPKTIIDGGVAWGTFDLYEVFPDAYYYMFEPIEEFFPDINNILEKHKGQLCHQALSDIDGKLIITKNKKKQWKDPTFASHKNYKQDEDVDSREVEQIKLDTFFKDVNIAGPVLLKTDLQGHDLSALRGARHFLKSCDVIISEISFLPIHRTKCNSINDFTTYLADNNFVCVDIYDPLRVPTPTGPLMQVDAVFLKKDSPLYTLYNREQTKQLHSQKI